MSFLQSIFGKLRTWITDVWARTERRDRVRFTVIAGVSITMLIGAFVLLSAARYQELVNAPDPTTLAGVTNILSENDIKYKVNGSSVLVDNANLARAASLIALDEQVGSTVDYPIYEAATGLTSTESEKRYYAIAQTEVHLKERLESSPFIQNARVNLNIPDNRGALLASEYQASTASVTLIVAEGVTLSQLQVEGVEKTIAGATGIAAENISIVDQFLKPLNARNEDDPATILASQLAYQKAVEDSLIDKINRIMSPKLGTHFSVALTVGIDFDDRESKSWVYNPVVDEDGIARSVQTVYENAVGRTYVNGEPGLDENGAGDEYSYVDDLDVSSYTKETETVNYEIDELVTTVKEAKGDITNFSVSLSIDTNYISDDGFDDEGNLLNDGVLTSATLNDYRNLIISAVGLTAADASRVTVEGAPHFGVAESLQGQETYQDTLERERLFELIRTLVLYGIIALCVILLVWRTLALFKPKTIELETEDDDYLVGNLQEYGDLVEAAVSSMELEVTKSSSRERIEEFIDNNPDAVANMLRSWMSEEDDGRW